MVKSYRTTCSYCGVGCGIVLHKQNDGKITLEGDKDHPVNKGMLCSKGMNLHYTLMDSSDRLLYPEMRYSRNHPRVRVSWDIALERTASVFKTLIQKYGPDSVAFYVSGQCLTEEYYVVNKLVKGFLGTNNIDTNSRLCMSSAVSAYKMSLGEDAVPVSYDDLELADVIFVAGANPAWCHPILWRRIEAAKQSKPELKIIVSDPRYTQSCAIADVHLQINPGTDATLHYAIGRCLLDMDAIDSEFVEKHTEGFEKYKQKVYEKSLEEAAIICGVESDNIRYAAQLIAKSKGFISMWTMGLNQSAIGVNKNLSLINLHLITGHIGKPGSGPFSLTGQPNAMGGREVGGLATMLAAHRDLANPQHRADMENFWQIPPGTIQPKPGLTATEMFDALADGKLKAIWIMCTNPLLSLPDVRKAEKALQNAKFVVVQDISNKPETIQYADVVLPAASWAEKEGTMTNAGRYITHLDKVVDAPGEALPDAEIICRFAKKMGFKGFDFTSPEEIYIEHAKTTKGTNIDISTLNYDILRSKLTVQWPFTPEKPWGTPRLFTDKKFYTPHQKAIIHALDDTNKSESTNPEFPLILTTGRIRDQWHTMSKTGKVNKLKQHISQSFLEIHPADALQRHIQNGQVVVVKSKRGEVRVKAKISEDIKKGVVFMPMHWGKILQNDLNRVNNLTNNLVDSISKEPDFKFSAVEVMPYQKPKQKIVIIGAGAAAHGFVRSYRRLNNSDSIEIFSKEELPFYNRVLLPDYVNGRTPWQHLVKMSEDEEREYNITLHRGRYITSIDRINRTVTDNEGVIHSYDILLLAMGSRPIMLKNVPQLKGIFTMRSRADADRFMEHVDIAKGKIVIVGGGLLGIELAAALNEIGAQTVIIQRISRLMHRQLDALGSQLLHEELTDRGVEIYYDDEVERYIGFQQVEGIKLKSGSTIPCQAVVIAVGTTPNVELAREAGISCNIGVKVNEYLQTDDPHIFAMGEVAEFKNNLYGITAAAEQQASIIAEYLAGDIASYYGGSLLMNILKIHGTDVCSLGDIEIPANNSHEYEEIVFIDKAKRYYKKCIVYQDRLVGAILIGDKSEFLEFKELIEKKIELSEKRLEILRGQSKAEPVIGRLICSCNNVGEGNLRNKIDSGCRDLLQLCQLSGAGMGCGSCRPEVKKILEEVIDSQLVTTFSL